MNKARAYEVLQVMPGDAADVIKEKYHTLCFRNHPDQGGDELVFKEVVRAYHYLKPYLNECPKCHGTGEVAHQKGFYSTYRRCSCRIKKNV